MSKYNSFEDLFRFINFDRMEPINFTYPIPNPIAVYPQEDAKPALEMDLRNPKDDELAAEFLND